MVAYLPPLLSQDSSLASWRGSNIDPLPGRGIDRILLRDFLDPVPLNMLTAANPMAPSAASLRNDLLLSSD